MKQLQLKQIGSFVKTHGIHGDLVLYTIDNLSFDLLNKGLIEKEAVFVEIDGISVPFFISENGVRSLNQKSILLKLDGVDKQKAQKFCGSNVLIEDFKFLGVETKNYDDAKNWIGFEVFDIHCGFIGKVLAFIELKGNPLLSIDSEGEEILIPLLADFIILVNPDKKELKTELPDGYIDALL